MYSFQTCDKSLNLRSLKVSKLLCSKAQDSRGRNVVKAECCNRSGSIGGEGGLELL